MTQLDADIAAARAVVVEDDNQPTQLDMMSGNERAHAELAYALAVLRKVAAHADNAASDGDVRECLDLIDS